MSHTPGPWMIETPESHGTRVRNELMLVAWCGCGCTVGIGGSHSIDATEATANARLVAAAPDMLQALKALFDAANHFNVDGKWFTDVDRNREILMNAEAVIAKAEGKE